MGLISMLLLFNVQSTTVCLMLILENLLCLKSKQADVTSVFLHATLWGSEKFYVKMPLAFQQCRSNKKSILLPKNSIYILCQSPCNFWIYLVENLANCGILQALLDPCLFIGEKNEKDIIDLAVQLHAEGVDLQQENDTARIFGVHIKHNPKTRFLNMMQCWELLTSMLEL
ncbi:hypothetical protein ACHAXS_000378 [Conticribra weissflogii]